MKKAQVKPDKGALKKITKKKVWMVSIAVLAGAAVIVGTLIPSAQEVVSPNIMVDPPAVTLNLEEDSVVQNEEAAAEAKKSNRFSDRLRNRLLSLPQSVRIIFVLPLWVLGWIVTSFGSLLWGGLFSPVAGIIASLLLNIGVIVGLFALTTKLLFPNIPFRKILSKKNIIPLVAVAVLVVALDAILPIYWEGYAVFSVFIKIVFPFSIVGIFVYRLKKVRSEEVS
ncbi:MAG: hypothetical protein EOM59_07370 [Clostridia bacterium]|nr:hypothetical protein [Clostridia bacterium]